MAPPLITAYAHVSAKRAPTTNIEYSQKPEASRTAWIAQPIAMPTGLRTRAQVSTATTASAE